MTISNVGRSALGLRAVGPGRMVQVGQTRAGLNRQSFVPRRFGLHQRLEEESRSLLAPPRVCATSRVLEPFVGLEYQLPDVGGFHDH